MWIVSTSHHISFVMVLVLVVAALSAVAEIISPEYDGTMRRLELRVEGLRADVVNLRKSVDEMNKKLDRLSDYISDNKVDIARLEVRTGIIAGVCGIGGGGIVLGGKYAIVKRNGSKNNGG